MQTSSFQWSSAWNEAETKTDLKHVLNFSLSDLQERDTEEVKKVKQTEENNCVLNHPTYSEALVNLWCDFFYPIFNIT